MLFSTHLSLARLRCACGALLLAVLVGSPSAPGAGAALPVDALDIREAQPASERGFGKYVSPGSVLARFDFEGGDTQGWQSVDTQEAGRNHWHVDDFAGLGSGYAPLSGAHSLWCGVRPEEIPPGWTYTDGYGNDWNDAYQVQEFSAPTGTIIEMELRYDLEDQKDWLYVEYRHGGGPWEQVAAYTGRQNTTIQPQLYVPPPFDPSEDTTVRWRVVTDDTGSDEYLGTKSNGAAIIDYIIIRDALGAIVRFEDFEGESVGQQTTNNGWFFAPPREPTEVGNRGALVSGSGVFQEDPNGPNTGHFWSFFQGSSDLYRCGTEPSQMALPRALDLANPSFFNSLRNRLESPWVDLDDVLEGDPNVGIQPRLRVGFRGYLDNPHEEEVYYRFELRWQMAGVQIPEWHVVPNYYYGTSRLWSNYVHFFDIPGGATHVQVGITVFDLAWSHNPAGVAGICHSHAPLFDDIEIGRTARPAIIVTNVDDDGPGSLRDAIEEANDEWGPDRIVFNISGAAREIVAQSPLPVVEGPCVIDAAFFPGHSGINGVALTNGYSNIAPIMGLTLADSVVVRDLWFYGFENDSRTAPSAGLQILGSDNVVEGCKIGVRPDGVVVANSVGILIANNTERNRIGGPTPGQGNVIQGNEQDGVEVDRYAWTGTTIRGNQIVDNGHLAVDVGEDGATANDPGDADVGPNGYQNHPLVTSVNGPLGRVEASLSSLPSTTYIVDFYRDTACGTDDRGQGRQYLGWMEITTDGAGAADFVFEVGESLPQGEVVVATATDPAGSTSEYSTCGIVEQTPAGSDVLAIPEGAPEGTSILFAEVTVAGTTTAAPLSTFPPLPVEYDAGTSQVFDLSTDAVYTGSLTVCLGYDVAAISGDENDLRLLHFDAALGAWQDATVSRDPNADIVCGEASSLSPFVIASPAQVTSVDTPSRFARELLPNAPNPFNPRTQLHFTLAADERVRLDVVDLAGRIVTVLIDEALSAGRHSIVWDATDAGGKRVASGVYLARLRGDDWMQSRKMALVR